MAINTTAGLLDAIVLAVVGREKTGIYGYKITQEVRTVLDLSESTLYPVLRRLQKDGCLRPAAHGLRCALQWPQPPLLSNHARRPRTAGRVCRRVGSLHHKDQQAF